MKILFIVCNLYQFLPHYNKTKNSGKAFNSTNTKSEDPQQGLFLESV